MIALLRHPARLLVVGFAAAVVVGGGLLALPIASQGTPLAFLDALFMAVSAVCVTGLAVVDPGGTFSSFGLAVLLILVQIGGLGIATLSTTLLLLAGQNVSFSSQDAVQESFTLSHRVSLDSLLRQVLIWTLAIEALGAGLLLLTESQRLPFGQAVWFSVFHAVTAFCNAGFALRPDNLMGDRANAGVIFPIALLVILGGLGFTVLAELVRWRVRRWRGQRTALSLHAKVALTMTGVLLLVGMIGFAALEWNNLLRDMGFGEMLLVSGFAAVTPRTAGFNTIDYGQATAATLYFTMVLMLIGGCPGSTAGGVKATTLGVLLALARSRYLGERGVRLFNRSVPETNLAKAAWVVALALVVATLGIILLLAVQIEGPFRSHSGEWSLGLLFEAVSALGTVGLSTGITPQLNEGGKILIMALMFVGRLGPLTIALAIARQKPRPAVSYAEEQVMIG
ncbi:MAG TPA: potassium transporter TrkG [Candidatus Competibacteraceae bacterium]|nr:potassium transporter TrkG [Candidatus Competibacteraceae bacterium]HSA47818.1 potassium transporter TrkG [Candidatus Competibacteraceae bacterium]